MFKYVVEYYIGSRVAKQVEIWASHEEEATRKAAHIYGVSIDPDDNTKWVTLGRIQ